MAILNSKYLVTMNLKKHATSRTILDKNDLVLEFFIGVTILNMPNGMKN